MYLGIYEAVEHRHLIQVYYRGYFRIVEPHVYGCDMRKQDVLKVYQLAGCNELGRHVGWKWFAVSRMDAVTVLSTSFSATRSEDGLRPKALQRIYCEAAPSHIGDRSSPGLSKHRHR
jgi:hypothetical protein